jgi:hypothetical protein
MGGEADDDLEEAVAAGKRATASLGFLASPYVMFVGAFIAATGALCALIGLVKHETELTIFGGADVISAGGACVLAWMIGRKAAAAGAEREHAWLEGLPFPIANHFVLLASGDATIEIHFRNDAPDKAKIAELAKDATGSVLRFENRSAAKRTARLSCRTVPALPGGHRIWRAWHDVVEKHLVPLHAKHEIATVRVEQ